jgi:peptide-methionine (S)-S-oxide reductase
MSATATGELATFGSGCFWCTEAVFRGIRGVVSAVPGYAGGTKANPTYEDVCTGTTGHAEVVRVRFDPSIVSYRDLLEVFWKTHDPTTPNRQGADVGTQYRSVVFCHNEEQARIAREVKRELDASGAFPRRIVTAIEPVAGFHEAEEYHHDYYARNPDKGYCQMVIRPKMEKFRKVFAKRLKNGG